MPQLARKPALWLTAGLILLDGLFFGSTDPAKISSPMLIVGFALVVLTVYLGVRSFHTLLMRKLPQLKRYGHVDLFLAGFACTALALQSVGQMTSRDFIILVLASAASYWYVTYQKRHPATAQT
ncbi:MAG: hypothetical protein JWN38_52 [Candidatus Saccharibacteria bacterium]|nr:hypothetical protein [Candidatus Saccharibacteria bacterium]